MLGSFDRVLVAELNRGQLDVLLRARYLVDTLKLNKVRGQPFSVAEILAAVETALKGEKR